MTPERKGRRFFRLYNCWSRKFVGIAETRAETWKRLSAMTAGRRDHAANWLRCCVASFEVFPTDHQTFTPEAAAYAEKRWRELHGEAEEQDV